MVNANDIREIDLTGKNNTPSVLGSNLEGKGEKINYNENGAESSFPLPKHPGIHTYDFIHWEQI